MKVDGFGSAGSMKNVIELLGILMGDGWLGIYGRPRRRKQVCFCGNLKEEREYRKYVQALIKTTLNVNGYYQERKTNNTYYIIINSETLFDFFHETYDFPVGKKYYFNTKKLPKTWNLQKVLIRGIFDTDGSFFLDRDIRYKVPYPILDITLKNQEVLEWIVNTLKRRGFRTIKYGRHIRLKGHTNIQKWFTEISPKNTVHTKKYSQWKEEYHIGPVAQLG